MRQFQESHFHDKISTEAGLANMVRCVDALPKAPTMPIGTIYQLTNSQPGYIATHIYMCCEESSIHYWKDITEDLSVTQDTTEGIFAKGYMYALDEVIYRIRARWSTPSDPENDRWKRDVFIRKLDGKPQNPFDGEVLVVSDTRDEYKEEANAYHSKILRPDPAGHEYFYRVMHIFATGKVTYTEYINTDILGQVTTGVMGYLMDDTYVGFSGNTTNLLWTRPYCKTGTWVKDVIKYNGTVILDTSGVHNPIIQTITDDGVKHYATRIYRNCGESNLYTMESYFSDGTIIGSDFSYREFYDWVNLAVKCKYATASVTISSTKYTVLGVAHPYDPTASAAATSWLDWSFRGYYSDPDCASNHSTWMTNASDDGITFMAIVSLANYKGKDLMWEYETETNKALRDVATCTYAGGLLDRTHPEVYDHWYTNPCVVEFVISAR